MKNGTDLQVKSLNCTATPSCLIDSLGSKGQGDPRGLRTASSVSSSCCFCTRCLAKGMVRVLNCVQRWGKRKVISYDISSSCKFGSVAENVGQAAMQAVLAGIAVVWTSDTHPPHFSSAAAFTSKNSISIHVILWYLSLVSEKVAAAYKTASLLRSLPHNNSWTSLLLHLRSSQLGMPGRNPISTLWRCLILKAAVVSPHPIETRIWHGYDWYNILIWYDNDMIMIMIMILILIMLMKMIMKMIMIIMIEDDKGLHNIQTCFHRIELELKTNSGSQHSQPSPKDLNVNWSGFLIPIGPTWPNG